LYIFNGQTPFASFSVDLGSQDDVRLVDNSIRSYLLVKKFKNDDIPSQELRAGVNKELTDLIMLQLEQGGLLKIFKPDSFILGKSESEYLKEPFRKMSEDGDIPVFLIPYVVCNFDNEYSYSQSGW
jgi:hypothetical protein